MSWFTELQKQLPHWFDNPSGLLRHPEEPSRRLGLALGGGGGKGGAHIGVLAVLETLDIPIDLMVGTSAGGAVSIFYGAGLSLSTINQLFRDVALRRIAAPDPTRTGFIGSQRRRRVLQGYLGDRTFNDLHIPCAVVTVDLVTGREVVLNEGSLVEAVLATTAVPGLVPPVVRGDQLLVDGGVLNNLPVNIARQMGADRVIGVELTGIVDGFHLEKPVPSNPISRLTLAPQQFSIANRALSLLMERLTNMQLAQEPPALLLRPDVGNISTLDLANPDEGQTAGHAAATKETTALLALRAWRTEFEARSSAAPRLPSWVPRLPMK